MKIIEKLIEAGVDNGEFICEDCEGTARNIMFVLEGLKISAQTIGVTAEAVDREILYLLRGLGGRISRQRLMMLQEDFLSIFAVKEGKQRGKL